ncbi:MAG: ThiF family adenylyltransferase [Cyclobacteriaceae bacterium]|jgi:molybdopterin/thiamine biosynthesis adenylyltransferase
MYSQLSISGKHHALLKSHLFPGDGKEAVAVALCGRHLGSDRLKLMVHDILLIPHDACHREEHYVQWNTALIIPFLERAVRQNLALLKIHSHPGGYDQFSDLDDMSDKTLFDSVFGWTETADPHGSAVMLPDGKIFGRLFFEDLSSKGIDRVSIAGDLILNWEYGLTKNTDAETGLRTIQAFGEGTYRTLKGMTIAVVGCSGTGSPVIEQLVRLGVGKIILIDPDKIELKNLNRILNSTRTHAKAKTYKVEVFKKIIEEIGLGTVVEIYADNLFDSKDCLQALISSDVILGCVDSIDGRDLLNRMTCYYLIPYFDLGIKLEADGLGGITKIVGTVNYIQPGKSSLMSRGLYDSEDLKAAGHYRMNPLGFKELVKNSYIKNINVSAPAVISVNMMVASYAVNELLNRIHPYKADSPNEFAKSTIDLTEGCFIHIAEENLEVDKFLNARAGLGDRKIFLDMMEFS